MDENASGEEPTAGARGVLTAVLDALIPPGPGGLPGAGALGLAPQVEAAAEARPELAPLLARGLDAAEAVARERGAAGFAALPAEARPDALTALAERVPAFLPTLTFLACTLYYQAPAVLEALGLEPRPPHPRGYAVPPTDFSLLDPVRRRPKLYREV